MLRVENAQDPQVAPVSSFTLEALDDSIGWVLGAFGRNLARGYPQDHERDGTLGRLRRDPTGRSGDSPPVR